jgi:hypothetical protein
MLKKIIVSVLAVILSFVAFGALNVSAATTTTAAASDTSTDPGPAIAYCVSPDSPIGPAIAVLTTGSSSTSTTQNTAVDPDGPAIVKMATVDSDGPAVITTVTSPDGKISVLVPLTYDPTTKMFCVSASTIAVIDPTGPYVEAYCVGAAYTGITDGSVVNDTTVCSNESGTGNPIAGLTVALWGPKDALIGFFTSNQNGCVILANLPTGNYTLTVVKDSIGAESNINSLGFSVKDGQYQTLCFSLGGLTATTTTESSK